MSAFDDILKSEQEAEKLIATAREEVAKDIAVARGERKIKIETEVEKLEEAQNKALEIHRAQVANMTEEIKKKVDAEVMSIGNKFESQKASLIATIKGKIV